MLVQWFVKFTLQSKLYFGHRSDFQLLTTHDSKSELVCHVNFDRNISPNSKGRSPIFLLGWPALGDCSICDIIPSNLSSGSFFYLPIWQAAVFEVWVSHHGLSIIPSDFLKNQSLKIIRKCLLYILWGLPTFK